MSERGLQLFLHYVANTLNQPGLATLAGNEHAQNLVAEAEAAGIPTLEITEEVGHIGDALSILKTNRSAPPKRSDSKV